MPFSRRFFLQGTLTTALGVAIASSTSSAFALDATGFDAMAENWGDILTGRTVVSQLPSDEVTQAITGLDNAAEKVLTARLTDADRTSVLSTSNLDDTNSKGVMMSRRVTETAKGIRSVALAWATPGSRYYKDSATADAVADMIDGLLTLRYSKDAQEYDNWWDWEIGTPRALGDAMCLMKSVLPEDLRQRAADAALWFIPDPRLQFQPPRKQIVSDGANRLDLCQSVMTNCIATNNAARFQDALAAIPDIWQPVTVGNGFYKDGSFVQHNYLAYTGGYGDVLISGLSLIADLVAGTELDFSDEDRATIYELVDRAFFPTMHNGQIFDCLRGRSVSRMTETAFGHGLSITTAILRLAAHAPQEIAERWRGIVAGWMQHNTYDSFGGRTLPEKAVLATVAGVAPVPQSQEPRMFASMDRLIHRTPTWTMALAMCSNRMSWYECGNQENEWGSRTGSGMRYLYVGDDMSQFEDGFWPTLNYSAPPGTTVDVHGLAPRAAGEWASKRPQNEWTGGLTHEMYSVAGMHLIGPDQNGLTARRHWMGDDVLMVEAATDVSTSEALAYTVVENRMVGTAPVQVLVDGAPLSEDAGRFDNPGWAHIEGVGGYVFLTDATVLASQKERSGTWKDLNRRITAKGYDETISRYWVSLYFSHQDGAAGAWVLLPGASADETKALATQVRSTRRRRDTTPVPVELLQNDATAQVTRLAGSAVGMSVWAPGNVQGWSFDQPVSLLAVTESDKLMRVSVTDPTQGADSVSFTVPGTWTLESFGVPPTRAEQQGDSFALTLPTAGLAGSPVYVTLRTAEDTATAAPSEEPSEAPSTEPSASPSAAPSAEPSDAATAAPSAVPSAGPSADPSAAASPAASASPSAAALPTLSASATPAAKRAARAKGSGLAATGVSALVGLGAVAALGGGLALSQARRQGE